MHSAPGAAQPGPTQPDGPQAALANLAAEFNDQDFDITLNPAEEYPPSMTVSNRHAQLSETIYADEQSFWWPWAQPIAALGNPKAAATKISYVLAAAPGTSHE